jgi:MFS family permease
MRAPFQARPGQIARKKEGSLPNRWLILLVLFFARSTMAFQFQSVAALAPFISDSYGASLADIGLLIGLYLAPGVIIAIPGGAGARYFGDRRIVAAGMIMMLLGGALMGFGGSWGTLVAGRVLAGAGGVATNVIMTKMLTDWFVGREISTAMGIFINSWPVGIAAALLVLPRIGALGGVDGSGDLGDLGGLGLAWGATLLLVALGLIVFLIVYRSPPVTPAPASGNTVARGAKLPVYALLLAAVIWALYNSVFAIAISFGPTLLVARDFSLGAAGSLTSLFIVSLALAVPVGGYLADRTGRRDAILLVSCVGFGVLMALAPVVPSGAIPAVFVAMGLFSGLAPGLIMSLPAQVLPVAGRALGMGVFYTIYYASMMVMPPFAGWLADLTGNIGVTFMLGGAMMAVCVIALGLFREVAVAPPASA